MEKPRLITLRQALLQNTKRRSKRDGLTRGARRSCRVERLEGRELFSGQAPLITSAAPFSEAYVNGVYSDTLGRPADMGALHWFTQQLDQGASLASVSDAIFPSSEYITNLVRSAYQQYLGQDPDAGELRSGADALASGLRDEQFLADLVASNAFYQRAGGDNDLWIQATYQAILKRAAEPDAVRWANGLLAAGTSREAVAFDVAISTEHEDQVVTAEYEHYIHQMPDSDGLTYWATQLSELQTTAESLAKALLVGDLYYATQTGVPPTVVPVPSDSAGWLARNAQAAAETAGANPSVLFIGDSITQNWQLYGQAAWNKYVAPLNALDAGVGGDSTQSLLWRIESGELNGLTPKVVVLMIGVNNVAGTPPQDVAAGVAADVEALREYFPGSKILLLSILPAVLTDPPVNLMAHSLATNGLIAGLADGQNVFYLDLWSTFTNPDGANRPELQLSDGIHLNADGYAVLAQAINPQLDELLGAS
ncbi:MAG: GDSL-type esterase/lipase family protein [Pirellulales bacterium]